MIWTSSRAHHQGWSNRPAQLCLTLPPTATASSAVHFSTPSTAIFLENRPRGQPLNDCKFLYGQSFVVYALVESFRASGEREALQRAVDPAMQSHLYDRKNGGWFEHTERDWRALNSGDPRNEVEVIGYEAQTLIFHWMEALTELYDVTRNPRSGNPFRKRSRININTFTPKDPWPARFIAIPIGNRSPTRQCRAFLRTCHQSRLVDGARRRS